MQIVGFPTRRLIYNFRILIRLDDNIIRHYSHEATFVIELNCVSEGKDFEVILTEIDVN